MRSLAILLLLAACGSDSTNKPVDGTTTPDTPGGGTPTCAAYCTAIQANCTAANLQYDDVGTCMATCPHLPVGAGADMSGNTLGCRSNHATLAHSDPGTHCVHAGPSGGGACGMPCEGFCSLVTAECPTQYPAVPACMTTCAGFNAQPPYADSVQSGDSLSCRIYHATAAALAPAAHCAHTQMTSATCHN